MGCRAVGFLVRGQQRLERARRQNPGWLDGGPLVLAKVFGAEGDSIGQCALKQLCCEVVLPSFVEMVEVEVSYEGC